MVPPTSPNLAPLSIRPLAIGPVVIDPPVLQAPMAGFTNYAYRQIIRQFGGVGLPATEMVSARGFLQLEARSDDFPDRLWGVREEPRPWPSRFGTTTPSISPASGRDWPTSSR